VRFARFIDYADAYVRAFCVFPSIQGFAFEPEQSRQMHARYFVPLRVSGSDTVFTLKPCVPEACASPKSTRPTVEVVGNIPRVASTTSTPEQVSITVHGTVAGQSIAATIYALDGRVIGESVYTMPTGNTHIVHVRLRSETASGVYFCRIHGSDGATICTTNVWY
jgi:hypothetical protein